MGTGKRNGDQQPGSGHRRAAAATRGMVIAVAGLFALAHPPSAHAAVQIVSDPLSAEGELVNASTWAEVAGRITFSTARQGDAVVALTVTPNRSCPDQPPGGVQTTPGPDANAESLPVLADREGEDFLLTPNRGQVTGHVTRLCAYLVRDGLIRERGSQRVSAVLAASASAGKPGQSADGSNSQDRKGLAAILLVLAGVGIATTVRKLRRLARHRRDQVPVTATDGAPAIQPAAPASDDQLAMAAENDAARLLGHVSFSKHALEQFATRAGLPAAGYDDVEVIIRNLLRREGEVRTEPPAWARSRNIADLYLQAGEWMLFILRRDRWLPWRYYCVTAVNGPENNTWENALRRGYIHTPPAY